MGDVLPNATSWMEMMKIYKRWCDPSILHMHYDWGWHGMPKIGIENPLKQVGHKNWQIY
jgi:hypothetical protein